MEWAAAAVSRYEELGLADALTRHYDYPWACQELSLILRLAYSKLPKNLQSLVFRDTISAFRLLPGVHTCHSTSSAKLLIQAAEASLPKQKRALAISEFKRAVVAHKRRGQACQDGGTVQLPQDVLIHIFSFLDVRSLVNSSLVCRAWHLAAADNTLWRFQYFLLFGDYEGKSKEQTCEFGKKKLVLCSPPPAGGEDTVSGINWRDALKRRYTAWKSATHRAICSYCKSIIWLSHLTNARSYHSHRLVNRIPMIKPLSVYKVVDYLLLKSDFTGSSSSSDSDDSDSDAYGIRGAQRLWAFPKLSS